jgi:hypothetical protein
MPVTVIALLFYLRHVGGSNLTEELSWVLYQIFGMELLVPILYYKDMLAITHLGSLSTGIDCMWSGSRFMRFMVLFCDVTHD